MLEYPFLKLVLSWGIVEVFKRRKQTEYTKKACLFAVAIGVLSAFVIVLDSTYRISFAAKAQLYTLPLIVFFFANKLQILKQKTEFQKINFYALFILVAMVHTQRIDAPFFYILCHLGIMLIISVILFMIGSAKTGLDITFLVMCVGFCTGFFVFETVSKDVITDIDITEMVISSFSVFLLQYLCNKMVPIKTLIRKIGTKV
jgi:hypothetical protein